MKQIKDKTKRKIYMALNLGGAIFLTSVLILIGFASLVIISKLISPIDSTSVFIWMTIICFGSCYFANTIYDSNFRLIKLKYNRGKK